MSVAEQYVSAFSNLAKQSNTILLPANTGDVTSMVSQVRSLLSLLGFYKVIHLLVVFLIVHFLDMGTTVKAIIFTLNKVMRVNLY